MATSLEYIAANAEDAIKKGLQELNLPREEVDIEILDNGSKGIFGIGARQARVRMTIREDKLRASMQKEETAAPVEEAKETETAPAEEPKQDQKPEQPKRGPKPARREKPVTEKQPEPVVNITIPEGSGGNEDDVVNAETLKIASNVVRDLMEKMRVKATIEAKIGEAADEVDSRVIMIDIQGDDLSFLIGRHSEVLHSLQYITSLIVGREVGHWVPLLIDVQGYRERRERQLRQMAGRMADQVVKTGRRISLEPMSATERRIIHIALRDNAQIITESIGEEPNRKVVIYPKENK